MLHLAVVPAGQLLSRQATATSSAYRDLLSTQQGELWEQDRDWEREVQVLAGLLLSTAQYY
jgi:hypothetical protein